MKIEVNRDLLALSLSRVCGVVSGKDIVPLLSNVVLEAGDRGVVLTTTDLTLSVRVKLPAKVISKGLTMIPAKRFLQLVREIKSPSLVVESGEKKGVSLVKTKGASFVLHSLGGDEEFPLFPKIEGGKSISLESTLFREMLVNTIFASAKDDSRHILKGLFLDIGDSLITLVATDGKRLSMVEKKVDINGSLGEQNIIPLKTVEEMIKMLMDDDGICVIDISSDKISLECGNFFLVSKLIVGKYPDYKRVLPVSNNSCRSVMIHKDEITSLLKQVSLFTSDSSKSVKFTFKKGELMLEVQNRLLGKGSAVMPINYQDDNVEIAFNPHYFLDMLKYCGEEVVNLNISDSFNPGSILNSRGYRFVLMPMRINN